ncbi:GT-D fold domain-containing glycosyltransferase [Cohnella ginsengisoli]|uniref:GT-D fold domain-containing glycosyltransferase n=1 Tax=Cohnella ginsengisoli TaxID=425004 RepID=A0A9X4KKC4_9BACL|nr:GT-D fold domain-containing glycosyltransferase [Cohnella ginsengisoli]MDG0793844.1 GT-D fold domain-containing glycosyltransferase [Cohnella ginsengisoli]
MEYIDYRYFTKDFSYEKYMLTIDEVIECIDTAVQQRKPYSLARFGHAEIAELREIPDLYQNMTYYRHYNGLENQDVRVELIKAFLSATTVGVLPTFADMSGAAQSRQTFVKLGLGFHTICSAWITHRIAELPNFWNWMKQYRVMLVGRRAEEAAPVFGRNGVHVAGAVDLEGYAQLESAYEQIAGNDDWQIAIISAGVPATILAPRLAATTGKVAIDFGHALDLILDGERFDFEALVKKLGGMG